MSVRGQVNVAQIVTLASLIALSGWWVLSVEETINWWGVLAVVGPMICIGVTLLMLLVTLSTQRKLILVEYVMLVLTTGATYWFVNNILPTADWLSLGRATLGVVLLAATFTVSALTYGSARPLRSTNMEVERA